MLVKELTRRLPASSRILCASPLGKVGVLRSVALTRSSPLSVPYIQRPFATQTPATSNAQHVAQPAQITQSEYHTHSDAYIDSLVEALEEMAESKPAMDVEYHSGVLNLVFPPAGTYVINKQPPNQQIWLSSPISGPKRYDFVKDSGGKGSWMYLRDGSTLTGLLKDELSLDFEPPESD